MELITLRQMCELLNISRRIIQCYEKAGLLKPTTRNKYGHLLYGENEVQRAKQIRFFQGLGFKLREIREIIDEPKEVLKHALKKRVEVLEKEHVEMSELIQEAYTFMETLN